MKFNYLNKKFTFTITLSFSISLVSKHEQIIFKLVLKIIYNVLNLRLNYNL
jgi:hypothetical protein